jgi:hypothetical protein
LGALVAEAQRIAAVAFAWGAADLGQQAGYDTELKQFT